MRAGVAYDGRDFVGWARQQGLRSVQGEIERVLGLLVGGEVELVCAGRTDAGVHARGQVVHLDLNASQYDRMLHDREPVTANRIDRALPDDIRVTSLELAPEHFDARFSAIWREYTYTVSDSPVGPDPLERHRTLAWYKPLDIDNMNEAATQLLGEHDFAPFCKAREFATTIRALQKLEWHRTTTGTAVMTIRADAFCHSMVRSIVGAMLPVGEGRRPVEWPGSILASGEKDSAVTTMPPHPLVLERVGYPADGQLLTRQQETRAFRTLD